jgi:hypothetical protein
MPTRLPIDKRAPRDFWDKQHKKLASTQIVWVLRADELLRAFELLARQAEDDLRLLNENETSHPPSVSGTAIMLGALAIENLLKAIRLPQVTPLFDKRGAFKLDTHDMLKLADDTGIRLSKEEQILLERLEQYLIWAGRYPIPLFSEETRPRTLPNGGIAPRTFHAFPGDFAAIAAFAGRLKNMLPSVSYGPEAT